MVQNVRARNKLPADMPLFLAQGAYNKKKLQGMYRFAMSIVASILDKKISAIPNRNAEEERILTMLRDGGSGVHEDYLAPKSPHPQDKSDLPSADGRCMPRWNSRAFYILP